MEILLIQAYTNKPWRSPETFNRIEDSLREKWSVTSINTKDPQRLYELCSRLEHENRGEFFVFNIAEYLDEEYKQNFIPALLDEWKVPHLGSSAESVQVGLDKSKTKRFLVKDGIPTPQYFIANKIDVRVEHQSKQIGFPLIVKPIGEGGHIGISDDSIVHDDAKLKKAISDILDTYQQPALIEAYINGSAMREFSVGIIDSDPFLFTPIEIDFDSMRVNKRILSYETAQKDKERIKLVEDRRTYDKIVELSLRTFQSVGAHDYSRIDLRMDQTGIYVLEINVMPGLGPHSFLPAAAKDLYGLDYRLLIQRLTVLSMRRQGISAQKF